MRRFRIILHFDNGREFSTDEVANSESAAVESAKRYARALGYQRQVARKTVREIG
jgi:hypothetical protein